MGLHHSRVLVPPALLPTGPLPPPHYTQGAAYLRHSMKPSLPVQHCKWEAKLALDRSSKRQMTLNIEKNQSTGN